MMGYVTQIIWPNFKLFMLLSQMFNPFGRDPPSTLPPYVMASITGTDLDNLLTGTAGEDTILGLGGNDQLNGLAGNDSIDNPRPALPPLSSPPR